MTRAPEPWSLRVQGLGWLAAWRITRALPHRVAVEVFKRLALRSAKRNDRRRAIVRANLAPVVPEAELDRAVSEAFASYGRYWAETFRMQDISSEELTRRFGEDGTWRIGEAFAEGKGAVLATPHLGNWDAGGRWVAERWPLTAVVEVLRPRSLFERFVAHRRSLGITIVPLERGGDATGACLERLRKGELVALVSDRDLSGSGVEVSMFGRRTVFPAGPAVLALRSGAPLLPACIYMEDNGDWTGRVLPRIDESFDRDAPDAVERLTQRLAEAFETLIARSPEQWHAFSRVWLEDA